MEKGWELGTHFGTLGKMLLVSLFDCLFIGGTEVWTQGLCLQSKVLYCLSHTSSPFCSDYFGDGPHTLSLWAGLELRFSQSQPPK
jgi:hypothetical protein